MNLNKEKMSDGTKDPRRKKWIKQRIKHGYSDRDVWSFDSFLASVISEGVRHIARFDGYKGESSDGWHEALNFIADQFEWYAKEQFSFSEDFRDTINDHNSDFHKAWVLLEKNFGGLWT